MAEHYTNEDKLRLRLLLPFYQNGTLDAARHAEVDAWLAVDAAGRQELQFMTALSAAARQRVAERAPLAGYDVLAARLAAARADDAAPKQAAHSAGAAADHAASGAARAVPREAAPAWWQRWWQGLASARWAPVAALGLALVSVQLGWNYLQLVPGAAQPDGIPAYRGGTAQAVRAAQLKLVVRRDARFAELAELLAQNRCHIVWGPSASGELWLALDEPAAAEPTRARLAASPVAEDVMLVRP